MSCSLSSRIISYVASPSGHSHGNRSLAVCTLFVYFLQVRKISAFRLIHIFSKGCSQRSRPLYLRFSPLLSWPREPPENPQFQKHAHATACLTHNIGLTRKRRAAVNRTSAFVASSFCMPTGKTATSRSSACEKKGCSTVDGSRIIQSTWSSLHELYFIIVPKSVEIR